MRAPSRPILIAIVGLLVLATGLPAVAEGEEPTGTAPGWSEPSGVEAPPPAGITPPATGEVPDGRRVQEPLRYANMDEPTEPYDWERAKDAGAAATPVLPQAWERFLAEPPPVPKDADGNPLVAPFVMPTETTILGVRKHHNRPWIGNWLALELEIVCAVIGEQGSKIGAIVTFYEEANGRPLRAAMNPYVDHEGTASVYTQAVPVEQAARIFTARLKIPYRAFPWPTKGPEYGVEARVRLLRQDTQRTVSRLATASTVFSIVYERGCGAADTDCPCPNGIAPDWVRDQRHDWHKMWGAEMGRQPSKSGLGHPKGPFIQREWYEWHRARRTSASPFK